MKPTHSHPISSLLAKSSSIALIILSTFCADSDLLAQDKMSPETLWQLGRVSAIGLSPDERYLYYKVTRPNMEKNGFDSQVIRYDFSNEQHLEVDEAKEIRKKSLSPDGKYQLSVESVQLVAVKGSDRHPDLPESDAYCYDDLHHRHWDSWRDGSYNHLMLGAADAEGSREDLMPDEPYDCPTVPFGGKGDYCWSPDSHHVVYVAKKKTGREYVNSTNTDLYRYKLSDKSTENLTADNPGYDTAPQYSSTGDLAWLSMARDGYEADKNDIKVLDAEGRRYNLTADWDGTVSQFLWSNDAKHIYFIAASAGTRQLFRVALPGKNGKIKAPEQITQGMWDLGGMLAIRGNELICSRSDMNRAAELYRVDLRKGTMRPITSVNEALYAGIKPSRVEERWIGTVDGKQMLVWVIYPPDFDPEKSYPTLLYTQGGPQSALSQFYSFRWNFQLMAAQGYIVVAPNRRGMPGHGVEWNEQISRDWGGLNMQDYLSAIDTLALETYVDAERLGCVGASYGGYSAFFLAGIHQGRFKTFISHCGIFNLKSMYGTTEELFFVNWDLGGPYWEKDNSDAQRAYSEFNPIERVSEWSSPILIIQGGRDYRVPDGQALEAFTAARQLGLKARLLYFPEENHWVLSPQNGLTWQREFFKWLEETL